MIVGGASYVEVCEGVAVVDPDTRCTSSRCERKINFDPLVAGRHSDCRYSEGTASGTALAPALERGCNLCGLDCLGDDVAVIALPLDEE